jgi:hypothetical protein
MIPLTAQAAEERSLKAEGKKAKAERSQSWQKFSFLTFAFCLVTSGCWLFQQPA